MRKRLAKKSMKLSNFCLWVSPDMQNSIYVPRNGRCMYLFAKAAVRLGQPDVIDKYTDILNSFVESLHRNGEDR